MLPPGRSGRCGAPPAAVSSGSRPVLALGRRRRRRAPAAATPAATGAAGTSSRNRSSRLCRRCSSRTSRSPGRRPRRGRGRTGVLGDRQQDGPPVRDGLEPARRQGRGEAVSPSSTSTARTPVRSVKAPSGAARSSWPASMATRKSHTRSISPRRWLATMTAMPNSVPVRRTSASISSRPAGSRPLVGSSSSSSRGSWTSAWASLTRCFIPVE